MQVSHLGEFFEISYYQLCDLSAMLRLVAGNIVARSQYVFRNVDGQQKGPIVNITMSVTQQQSDDLKVILAQILQNTNADIEIATGWTKYVPPEESGP